MRELLYYPSFEIKDENWLKFALLYIGKLRPIVPQTGLDNIDGINRTVLNETNLLDYYRPTHSDSNTASFYALEAIEKIFSNPQRYSTIFGTRNIVNEFIDTSTHEVELFKEKYTYDFKRFCKNKKIATETDNGLMINRKLSNLFMTIFTNIIAENNNMESITDNERMDLFNIFSREVPSSHSDYQKTIKIAKTHLQYKIPKKIEEIPIEAVIELRNSDDFMDYQKSYNIALNDYLDQVSEFGNVHEFQNILDEKGKLLNDEIKQLSRDSILLSTGVWVALSSNNFEGIVGATIMGNDIYNKIKSIKRNFSQNKNARFARKYLKAIERIDFSK